MSEWTVYRCPATGRTGLDNSSRTCDCPAPFELIPVVPARTPLHELVDLCREQGMALDLAMYGPDEGQLPGSDDTKSTYIGGARITGHKGDPMDVVRAGVRARRHAVEDES